MSYDSECERLARHFYPTWDDEAIALLAQELQDCVEGIDDEDGNPSRWWLKSKRRTVPYRYREGVREMAAGEEVEIP